jgi:hypothetical protein
MNARNILRTLFILFVVLANSPLELSLPTVRVAEAVVGRPLTPVSYAGVARRTSRRTTRRAVAGSAYY